jgi:hypothetical protein
VKQWLPECIAPRQIGDPGHRCGAPQSMSLRGPTFGQSDVTVSDLTVGPSASTSLVTGWPERLPLRKKLRSPSDPALPCGSA